MGKLFIAVNECHLMRSKGFQTVNPRIRLVVDGLYKFQTRRKHDSFIVSFDETFSVGNTHRFAVIEVSAYHCATLGALSTEEEVLLGTCRLSIERVVRAHKRNRNYTLIAPDNSSVVGTVNMTLKSDSEGDFEIPFTNDEEDMYVKRLTRFLICHDRSLLVDMDLIMSSVKGTDVATRNQEHQVVTNGECANGALSEITSQVYGTFDDLMKSFCVKYKCKEPERNSLTIHIEGCTNLDKPASFLPSHVFVVLRTDTEEFITIERPLTTNPIWNASYIDLDVIEPDTFTLNIMVVHRSTGSKCGEVGYAIVHPKSLTRGHRSSRPIFIFSRKDSFLPYVSGMIHLYMQPHHFEHIPSNMLEKADDFYIRLNRFFYRYDIHFIPMIDSFICARLYALDDLMSELEVLYGREPGTMELSITVHDVHSLHADAMMDIDDRDVQVIITMGELVMRTEPKRVKANSRTGFNETFAIDVSRETDMIKFEVIRANHEDTVYGRADFTCLKLQRSVKNHRMLYLVGKAGTQEAHLSGMISITLFSEQLGQPWAVDTEAETMYAGRLRRYIQRRVPQKLHLVDIAVCTVFDIEGFLADLAREYGEEDPTYAVYVTLLGCRQLRCRLGFSMNAYVVMRMGIDRYETHVVRDSTEPDFFHFAEFFVDHLQESQLTIVVMDRYGLGSDREVGRVVISLGDYAVERQYHEWLPLELLNKHDSSSTVGMVGVKFVVKNLDLKDSKQRKEDLPNLGPSPKLGPECTLEKERRGIQRRWNLGGWRNKLSRVTGHLRSRSNTSMDSSDGASTRDTDTECTASLSSMNIMDEGIHSVNEFCSTPETSVSFERSSSIKNELNTVALHNEGSEMSNNNNFNSGNGDNLNDAMGLLSELSPSTVFKVHPKRLRVRVICCENLQARKLTPPSPYVMLSTLQKTQSTMLVPNSTSPKFNEEFTFHVENPEEDFLSIIVITDTPYGKKCMGYCILSLKNVQRDTPRTRWVSLVTDPSRPWARQQGTICLTILGENFGLDYLPSIDAENRLRELLRTFLTLRLPQEVHRLEFYIGEFATKSDDIIDTLTSKHLIQKGESREAVVTMTLTSVTNLFFNDRQVMDSICIVKAKIDDKTVYRTNAIRQEKVNFNINESFDIAISNKEVNPVRLVVYIEQNKKRHKCGECFVSFDDLRLNVIQERTHILVINPGHSNATPVGCITVSLLSTDYGTSVSTLAENGEDAYSRMRDYYYYYLRPQLHNICVKYTSTFNTEAHLKSLVEKNGPEPGNYNLCVTIRHCRSGTIKKGSPYCILRVGLRQYETAVATGDGEYSFFETFNIPVGLPDKEEVHLILLVKDTASKSPPMEAGRTVLPLKNIVRGSQLVLQLPLVYRAQTKGASVCGSVELTLFTEDFGVDPEHQNSHIFTEENLADRLEREFSRHHPEEMHRLPSIIADAQEQDDRVSPFVRSFVSSAATRVGIMIVSLRDFTEKEVYIKAYVNGKSLFRTGDMGEERFNRINEEFLLDSSIDVETAIISLKFATRQFRRSNVLCYCSFAISRCVRNKVTEKWLRLFNEKGRSLGRLCVRVDMPPQIGCKKENTFSAKQLESVEDDVVSLMAKYTPKELSRVDVMVSRGANLRTLHLTLRQQLAPNVQATVFLVVHELELLNPTRGRRVVQTTVLEDVVRVVERRIAARPMHSTESLSKNDYSFPSLRVDIVPNYDSLNVRIFGSEENLEVCRTKISLRALLTPLLYDFGEKVSVPLVKVTRRRTDVHAGTYAGTLTFSLVAPTFEKYSSSVQLALPSSTNGINREFVHYYLDRIILLLTNYDANSLTNIHQEVFEKYMTRESWEADLPRYLESLVQRWGPEVKTFGTPPPAKLETQEL